MWGGVGRDSVCVCFTMYGYVYIYLSVYAVCLCMPVPVCIRMLYIMHMYSMSMYVNTIIIAHVCVFFVIFRGEGCTCDRRRGIVGFHCLMSRRVFCGRGACCIFIIYYIYLIHYLELHK